MEQEKNPELLEFRDRMAEIREKSVALQKTVLSEEEEKEENQILGELDNAIQVQTFSSLQNLVLYQIRGWKAVIDE